MGLGKATAQTELKWFRQNRPLPVGDGRTLLVNLSKICDGLFPDAPRVCSELLNRHELSSAAAARMRLIERLLTTRTLPLLGMDASKRPPEMSMYLSVLKRGGGLHREVSGEFDVVEPPPGTDTLNLVPALRCIRDVLTAQPDSRVPVPLVFDALSRPPHGGRAGLAPFLLALFAAIHEEEVALYSNGAFVRRMTGQDFMRLVKAPDVFEVQFRRVAGVRAILFARRSAILHARAPGDAGENMLDVVRTLCVPLLLSSDIAPGGASGLASAGIGLYLELYGRPPRTSSVRRCNVRIGPMKLTPKPGRPRVGTLLSHLRSADADLSNPRHDLACRYVAEPAVALKIVRGLLPPARKPAEDLDLFRGEWRGTIHTEFAGLGKPTFHSLLSKRTGRSDTAIGYVDVIQPYTYETRRVGESRRSQFSGGDREWQRDPLGEWYPVHRKIVVEIKVSPVSVGEVVRQVALYREHLKADEWVVATAFPVTSPELSELTDAKITHFRLGAGFERWAAAQECLPPDQSSVDL